MPRLNIDYSKIVIYKIVCDDFDIEDCYVGSTTDFVKRKSNHKSTCHNSNSNRHNLNVYQFIRANGGWDNWSMLELEKYPCNDNNEATLRERHWMETLNAELNSKVPSRTAKEFRAVYLEENKDEIKKKNAEYYIEHIDERREMLNERARNFYDANKDKINASEAKKAYKKQYYIDHKDAISEKSKELRIVNKEEINKRTNARRKALKEERAQLNNVILNV
jgi:hypothetical protein